MEINELDQKIGEYRASIFEKIVGPMDAFLLCKLKIQQLRQAGEERNHFNLSHIKMMAQLSVQAETHKTELAAILESPFIQNNII